MMVYKLAYVAIKRFVVTQEVKGIFSRPALKSLCEKDWLKFAELVIASLFDLWVIEYFFLYFFVIQLCDVISKWEQAMRQSQGRLDTSRVIKLSYKNRWLLMAVHSKRIFVWPELAFPKNTIVLSNVPGWRRRWTGSWLELHVQSIRFCTICKRRSCKRERKYGFVQCFVFF